MSKAKKIYVPIIILIINILIAFTITYLFELSNTVIFRSLCYTVGDITYETVIFFFISFIELIIYNLIKF